VKFVIITGGVISGIGKGITTASIGRLLKSRGFKVTAVKIDPYLNCDAGTMNPYQHGEVYVMDDGGEADLDIGHYERFLDIELGRKNNITTGKIYLTVIEKERRGDYLGDTVQIIPHVTNEIIREVVTAGDSAEIELVEIGGTVGDIESMPFLEAMRELRLRVGRENILFGHVTLVPEIKATGEQKTKPTQHSIMALREIGIKPDFIIVRGEKALEPQARGKISLFCDVEPDGIISAPDVANPYEMVLKLGDQGLTEYITDRLDLKPKAKDLGDWVDFIESMGNPTREVKIGAVGKYTKLRDAYLSYIEAIKHAAAELKVRPMINWIAAEDIEKGGANILQGNDCLLIPGGFGKRGSEGKIEACRYARENDIPFLGICFGFQLAVIEYCRNVLGLDATSTEFDPDTPHPVVTILEGQGERLGGTMRLGSYPVVIAEGTRAHAIYDTDRIEERHRHRYEVNPDYVEKIEERDMKFSGRSEDGFMELLEIKNHGFYMACQFHPEFKSRPRKPAPLFLEWMRAGL
jgi:CTP synthase